MSKALFRINAGKTFGNGHLMRCLPLAEELNSRGVQIILVTNITEGFSLDKWMKIKPIFFYCSSHLAEDYQMIKDICDFKKVDILIFDGYFFKNMINNFPKFNVKKIAYIDDDGFDSDNLDLIINQTASDKNFLEKNKTILNGYKYFLVSSDLKKIKPKKKGSILINFGSSECLEEENKILQLLSSVDFKNKIFISPRKQLKSYNLNINFIINNELSNIFSQISYAITAPGYLSLELAYLKIYMFMLKTSEAQKNNITFIEKNNLGESIKDFNQILKIHNNQIDSNPSLDIDHLGPQRISKYLIVDEYKNK